MSSICECGQPDTDEHRRDKAYNKLLALAALQGVSPDEVNRLLTLIYKGRNP